MRFENPELLFAAIPVIAVAVWAAWRSRRIPATLRFSTVAVFQTVQPPWWSRLVDLPMWLRVAAALIAVVALARPQVRDTDMLTGEGSDFVVALDMSGSMNAVDLPAQKILEHQSNGREPPSRFEAARSIIKDFIVTRDSDRIGLVIFAGKAYVKFPLTMDKDAMLRILDGLILDDQSRDASGNCLNSCTITGEKTAIGDALGRAFKRIEDSRTKSRNIILITDGDNNAGKVAPEEVAKFIGQESSERPVRTFTFLVGSDKDTYMPATHAFTGQPLFTPDGYRVYEPVKNQMPVNPELLQNIADRTGGRFFSAPTEDDFRKEFDNMEKTEFSAPALRRYREAYLWPLTLALILAGLAEISAMTVLRRWP